MDVIERNYIQNIRILKARANRFSVQGVLIAIVAILVATLLVSYQGGNVLSISSFMSAQANNPVLWLLDGLPFLFAIWGQYSGSMIAQEASTLLDDHTRELRDHTSKLELKLNFDATHDAVTSLPNRILLRDRLMQAIRTARREKHGLSVIIMGINNLKEINNTIGHHSGDKLLKLVAVRLTGFLRQSDTVARTGGDEFSFVMPSVCDMEIVTDVAEKIHNAMAAPFDIEEMSLSVHLSIGIAIFPDHGVDEDTLLQHAAVARHMSKQQRNKYVVYDSELDLHSPKRLTLMSELRKAISNNELVLHYQPKLDLRGNTINSAEALVRWNHPNHGLIGPDEFIPLAERTGLIEELTVWVIREALGQLRARNKNGNTFQISINLSVTALFDVNFPDVMSGLFASYDVPAERVIFEITESAFMHDQQRAMQVITQLNKLGCGLSIDDFGTGYSSLSYLSTLPVQELKIDKSFVQGMASSKNDEMIVRSIIDLAHNLGLQVTAEGVEQQASMEQLKAFGCDLIQGFLIARPMPADDLLQWLPNARCKVPA